ncbi:MAG: hypothetical protein JWN01_1285 [Patescibacteria group bacterium]|nr:hypothetical protein [Patescibacteria group bacterium]
MQWEHPPIIKVYEALGAIGDGRVALDGNTAKVYSSSGNKYYQVAYDPDSNSITSNDNGSYWVGYLGYPSISFLLLKGIIGYEPAAARLLKGIAWKDINTRFKNDFDKTEAHIRNQLTAEHDRRGLELLDGELDRITKDINKLGLLKLPSHTHPPIGY